MTIRQYMDVVEPSEVFRGELKIYVSEDVEMYTVLNPDEYSDAEWYEIVDRLYDREISSLEHRAYQGTAIVTIYPKKARK